MDNSICTENISINLQSITKQRETINGNNPKENTNIIYSRVPSNCLGKTISFEKKYLESVNLDQKMSIVDNL